MAMICKISVIILAFRYINAEANVIFHIEEESPTGTLIGNVAAASGLNIVLSTENSSSVRFNLLQSTKITPTIELNRNTGDLYVIGRIDRERECSISDNCTLKFKVACYSSARFDVVNVNVVIDDINDNAPSFPADVVTLKVFESAVPGTIFSLDTAYDEDIAANSILKYEMDSMENLFELRVIDKPNIDSRLQVVLKMELDREQEDTYSFNVIAKDSGRNTKTGSCRVNIEVIDENDNTPIFDKEIYHVSVRENSEIGTVIIKLNASDLDDGQNGEVRYRFSSRQANLEKINNFFHINNTEGEVIVRTNLISRAGEDFAVVIEARDKGERPRSSLTTVNIRVLDVSNNEPEMRVDFLSSSKNTVLGIPESSDIGSVVAYMTVEDRDSGDNGKVACNLSVDVLELRSLEDKSYIIVTSVKFDREDRADYNISVTCRDGGTPSLSVSTSFKLHISDENDNAPIFSQSVYFVSITENNRIGTTIAKVRATDRDNKRNSVFQYHLDESANTCFSITPKTGIIKATCSLDRETQKQYRFTVMAIDYGVPSLTGTASVVLSILDQNDNKPEFQVKTFQFFVLENMPPGIKVGSLSAIDADEGVNQNVLFSIEDEYKSSSPFTVFQNGDIQTNTELDREARSTYRFQVTAYDLGTPSRTSTANVLIRVADDNDNVPVIMFPSKINESFSVSYSAPIGTIVTKIQAYDLDEDGPNSNLKYSLSEGNEAGIFSIDENLGIIQLNKNKVIEKDEIFKITVSVKDSGYTSNVVKKVLYISLRYNNESSVNIKDIGSHNAIITTSVVTLTIVITVIISTVICIIKRNSHKRKLSRSVDEESNRRSTPVESNQSVQIQVKHIISTGVTTERPDKTYLSTTDDEDLDNMELFNSSGTSMFTNTLIESQKFVTSAEEYSEDSDDDLPKYNNRSKGGSYLDIYKLNRMKTLGYFGPKPKFQMHSMTQHVQSPMDVI